MTGTRNILTKKNQCENRQVLKYSTVAQLKTKLLELKLNETKKNTVVYQQKKQEQTDDTQTQFYDANIIIFRVKKLA